MATGQLILNIALDMAQVASGVPKVISLLESMNIKVKQTASTMKVVEQSTKGMFDQMTKGWVGLAAKFNTLDYTLRILKNAFMATFGAGFKAVNDFKLGTASATAVVAQFMELNPGETIADGFQRATAYAEDMYPVLEKIAAKTLLSGRETQLMFQEFAKGGVLLDATNKKAVEGFSAMGNAIAIMTQGQDKERQILTEVKAVMEGQNRAGAIMIRLLESQNPHIKEQLKLWKEEGTVLEHISDLLKGFNLASGKLELTLDAVITRLQTSMQQISRGAFADSFDRVLKILVEIDDYLQRNKDTISKDIYNALTAIEKTLSGILYLVQQIFGATEEGTKATRTFFEGWLYLGNVIFPGILEFLGNIAGAVREASAALGSMMKAITYRGSDQWKVMVESWRKAEEHAKNVSKYMFPGGEGIFERLNREYEYKQSMQGWDNIIGKRTGPPKTKSIADDIVADAKKIQDSYDELIRSLEREISTAGLEGWRKSLAELETDIEKWQKAGFSNHQIYKALQLKLQLVGKEKAIQDLKEAELQAEATAKAIDTIRENWKNVAEESMGLEEAMLRLKIAQEDLTKAEELEAYIEATQKLIDKQEWLISLYDATAKGSAEWLREMARLKGYQTDLANLNQSLKEIKGTFAEGFSKGIREATEDLSNMYETGKRVAEDLTNAFQNFFEDAFRGNIKDAWKNLLDDMETMFVKFLARLATKAVMEELIVPAMKQIGSYVNSIGTSPTQGITTGGMTSTLGMTEEVTHSLSELPDAGKTFSKAAAAFGVAVGAFGLVVQLVDALVAKGPKTPSFSFKIEGDQFSIKEKGLTGSDFIYKIFTGTSIQDAYTEWLDEAEQFAVKATNTFKDYTNDVRTKLNELGIDISGFLKDWKSGKIKVPKGEDFGDVFGDAIGKYLLEITDIKFQQFQKVDEDMMDTMSRVLTALVNMKNIAEDIDIVIANIGDDELREFNLSMAGFNRTIASANAQLKYLTDPSDIAAVGQILYDAVIQRYEAEIAFVKELEQSIKDLQIEFAQFTSSMIRKIAELGGGASGFDDAIKMIGEAGYKIMQDINNPQFTLEEKYPMLLDFLSFLDEWYSLSLEKIQVLGEAEILIYEDKIEALSREKDIIDDQIDALQQQLKLVERWKDILDRTQDMLLELRTSTASPRDAFERLNTMRSEIERVRGLFLGSSGDEQQGYARQLQDLISQYMQLSQQTYQRPSQEYQAIYEEMIAWLEEIQAISAQGAENAEELLQEIEALQQRSNAIQEEINGWQEKIYQVQERMDASIKELNAEAKGYYEWAQNAGVTIYTSKIDTLQTTLIAVLGPDGTVAQYIERQRSDMVRDLSGIKEYLNGILFAMTGYDALANQSPVESPPPPETPAPVEPPPDYWWNIKNPYGLPSYQHGTDYVPQTGLAYLHQGEKVIPAGDGGINLTLAPTIYANGDATPREIWRELEEYAIQSVKGGRLGKALKER